MMKIKKTLQRIVLGTSLITATLGGISEYVNYRGMQQDSPQIAQDRIGVFVPIINDLIYRGIAPFGYDTQTKKEKLIPSLIFGREHNVPAREDAWRLYLGKPQTNNTFSISDYSPEDSSEVCYKINNFFGTLISSETPEVQIRQLCEQIKLNPNITHGDFNAMGGYHIGVGKDKKGSFLFYQDRWDLDGNSIEGKRGFFGKPFNIYDRLYFDENTFKPERPISPSSNLGSFDSSELM